MKERLAREPQLRHGGSWAEGHHDSTQEISEVDEEESEGGGVPAEEKVERVRALQKEHTCLNCSMGTGERSQGVKASA